MKKYHWRVFRGKIWYPLLQGVIFYFPVPILQTADLSPSFFTYSGIRTYRKWSVCQSSAMRTQKQILLDFSHAYPSLPQVCLGGVMSLLMVFSYPTQHHFIARLDQSQSSAGICVQQHHAYGWAFTLLFFHRDWILFSPVDLLLLLGMLTSWVFQHMEGVKVSFLLSGTTL